MKPLTENNSPSDWLVMATEFTLGKVKTKHCERVVQLKVREQIDGGIKWIVQLDNSYCLNKYDGNCYLEPSPSNRSDKFIEATRFGTKEAAFNCALNLINDETLCIVSE